MTTLVGDPLRGNMSPGHLSRCTRHAGGQPGAINVLSSSSASSDELRRAGNAKFSG